MKTCLDTLRNGTRTGNHTGIKQRIIKNGLKLYSIAIGHIRDETRDFEMVPIKLADFLNPGMLDEIPREQISPLLIQLAAIQSALASRLLDSTEKTNSRNGDKLLEVKEAAAKLSVTEDWLYRKGDKLPFVVRMGRNIRFSEQGIEKYIRQRTGH